MTFMDRAARPGSALLSLTLIACGDDRPNADPPELYDLAKASSPMQTAAKAVVRIVHPAGIAGTGSFISADGLLMTNAHVLGGELCLREGCAVSLSFEHERGQLALPGRDVYAVPEHVDVGLDMAVLRVFLDEAKTQPLGTPDFLSFDPRVAADLVGEHVTAVGHPFGALKKWSSGYVVDVDGEWFDTTVFSLPGGSGSPILSDAGLIVGLLHRGAEGFDLLTSTSAQVTAIATAGADLQRALTAPLPASVLSLGQPITPEQALQYSAAFLAASTWNVDIAGQSVPLVSLMGADCDAGLAREDYTSFEELESALSSCFAALDFIECRSDVLEQTKTNPKPCPADREAWLQRLQTASDKQQAFNGSLDLSAISYSMEALADNYAAGEQTGRMNLVALLARTQPKLDFTIASYLAAYGVDTYANQSTRDYFLNYEKVPFYERNAYQIATSAFLLYSTGELTSKQTLEIARDLYHDRDVSVGAKLQLEELLYNAGTL